MNNLTDEIDPDLDSRIRQAIYGAAKTSGIPWKPFTHAMLAEASALGEAMDAVAAMEICGILEPDGEYNTLDVYDTCCQRNPHSGELMPRSDEMVQMLAAQRVSQYQRSCQEYDDRLIDPRYAPSYDEGDPLTATRVYVLLASYERMVPLEIPYDWKAFLLHSLGEHTKCDVHLLHRCYDHQQAEATQTLVYKRGEYLCAFKICNECLDALSWVRYEHCEYAGPLHHWYDDGKVAPRRRDGSPDIEW